MCFPNHPKLFCCLSHKSSSPFTRRRSGSAIRSRDDFSACSFGISGTVGTAFLLFRIYPAFQASCLQEFCSKVQQKSERLWRRSGVEGRTGTQRSSRSRWSGAEADEYDPPPRTLPGVHLPAIRSEEGGRHGRGWQEGLGETLLLLQIPGQIPAAAAAEPIPQPHQAGRQQG